LHHGFVLKSLAPLPVCDWLGAWRGRSTDNGFGQFLAERVLRKQGRISNDRVQFLFQPGFIPATKAELGNKIGRPPGGFTQRDSEADEIFRVHELP